MMRLAQAFTAINCMENGVGVAHLNNYGKNDKQSRKNRRNTNAEFV